MLDVFLICLIAGIFAGLTAGLFGVGGGMIVVPTLMFILPLFIKIDPSMVLFVSVGSSFVTVFATSISSAYKHYRFGNVCLNSVKRIIITLIISTVLISLFVVKINPGIIQLIFGSILLYSAVQMLLSKKEITTFKKSSSISDYTAGSIIGSISATSGIGGGSFIVSYLVNRGVVIHKAIGTSSLCGVFVALSGSISYLISGIKSNMDLPYSTGFLLWPAILGVIITSMIFSQVGATIANKLPVSKMKKIFAIFLVFVSSNIIYSGIKYILAYL